MLGYIREKAIAEAQQNTSSSLSRKRPWDSKYSKFRGGPGFASFSLSSTYTRSTAPRGKVESVSIHLMSDQEKLKSSVSYIEDVRSIDKRGPHPNGLNDLRLGPSDITQVCATCDQGLMGCPGHPGHTLFLRYKYHVCYLDTIFRMLSCLCHVCHQIKLPPNHPEYIKALALPNPKDRLAALSKACRKVEYCGGVDPRVHTTSASRLSRHSNFLDYLAKRRSMPQTVAYQGCGSLQRIYVQNKKEPLNIRCFERIESPPKQSTAKKGSGRRKSKSGNNEEGEDCAEEEEEEDEAEDLEEENEEDEEVEEKADVDENAEEDAEDAAEDDEDGEANDNEEDEDNEDDEEDPDDDDGEQNSSGEFEDDEIAPTRSSRKSKKKLGSGDAAKDNQVKMSRSEKMPKSRMKTRSQDLFEDDDGDEEEEEEDQDESEDPEEENEDEEEEEDLEYDDEDDDDDDDDGEADPANMAEEKLRDKVHAQQMQKLIQSHDAQIRRINETKEEEDEKSGPSTIDFESADTASTTVPSSVFLNSDEMLDFCGPVNESFVALPYNQLAKWFNRRLNKGDLQMVPFCAMATMRRRPIPKKIKKSLPPFDLDSELMFTPNEAYGIFRDILPCDYSVLGFGGESVPSSVCYRVLVITPPAMRLRSGALSSDTSKGHGDTDATKNLRRILLASREVKNLHQQVISQAKQNQSVDELFKKLLMAEEHLHLLVSAYIHRDQSGIALSAAGRNKVPSKCIIDAFLLKEGRVRGNLNAKRVNHSARSTISPFGGFDLEELGTPIYVCMNTTFMEPVNEFNIQQLQLMVHNGPFLWPGAKKITRLDGTEIDLRYAKAADRILRKGFVVERHLIEGDIGIFNRAPSLHCPSMMAHKLVPVKGNAFRLHLVVTTPYNADFDGDEMNLHIPITIESLAQCRYLMMCYKQMMGVQDSPLIAAKLNTTIESWLLTDNRRLYSREDIFNSASRLRYLFRSVDNKNDLDCSTTQQTQNISYSTKIPPPAVWIGAISSSSSSTFNKNKNVVDIVPMWTGKQMFSLALPNVCYRSGDSGPTTTALFENKFVCVQNGRLLSGQIGDIHLGCKRGTLLQKIYFDLGEEAARKCLSEICRNDRNLLQQESFSVLVHDLIIPLDARKDLKSLFEEAEQTVAMKSVKLADSKPTQLTVLYPDRVQFQKESVHDVLSCNALQDSGPIVQLLETATKSGAERVHSYHLTQKNHPQQMFQNSFRALLDSGTKGKEQFLIHGRTCTSQQRVQGERNGPDFGARSFPHVPPHCLLPRSKGFSRHSYVQGQTCLEVFQNSQAGNEGLSQSSTAISAVGYSQRRLTKALEDEMLQYDSTIRSLGQISSFVYGDEGFAPNMLNRQHYPWLNLSVCQLYEYFGFGCVDTIQLNGAANTHPHNTLSTTTNSNKSGPNSSMGNSYSVKHLSSNKLILTKIKEEHVEEEQNAGHKLASIRLREIERIQLWTHRLKQYRVGFEINGSDLNQRSFSTEIKTPVQFNDILIRSKQLTPDLANQYSPIDVQEFICKLTLWIPKHTSTSSSHSIMADLQSRLRCEAHEKLNAESESDMTLLHNCVTLLLNTCHSLVKTPAPKPKFTCGLVGFLSCRMLCFEYSVTWIQFAWILQQIIWQYARGLASPGEMVGIIAAQSASEPTAQLMLRAFHLTGSKQKEEHLTIPRLEEILRKTVNISQSILRAALPNQLAKSERVTDLIMKRLQHRHLAHFVRRVEYREVKEDEDQKHNQNQHQNHNNNVRHSTLSRRQPQQQQQQPHVHENEKTSPLHRLSQRIFGIWHQDTSKHTKPVTAFTNSEYKEASTSSSITPTTTIKPNGSFTKCQLVFHFDKYEMLNNGITLRTVVNSWVRILKNSAHLHQWVISPYVSKNWYISIRFSHHSRIAQGFWKKTQTRMPKLSAAALAMLHSKPGMNKHLYSQQDLDLELEDVEMMILEQSANQHSNQNQKQNHFVNNNNNNHAVYNHDANSDINNSNSNNLSPHSDDTRNNHLMKFFENALLSVPLMGNDNLSHVTMETGSFWKKNETGDFVWCQGRQLDMNGSNLYLLSNVAGIDATQLYTNNICEMQRVLDVHAAMFAVFKEMSKVFQANDGYVNSTHLWCIAKFMGRKGQLAAYTRTGFNEDAKLGFLKKMSFEKILQHILTAAQQGDVDHLQNLTSNILVGKPPPFGTNLCQVRINSNNENDGHDHYNNNNNHNNGGGGLQREQVQMANFVQLKSRMIEGSDIVPPSWITAPFSKARVYSDYSFLNLKALNQISRTTQQSTAKYQTMAQLTAGLNLPAQPGRPAGKTKSATNSNNDLVGSFGAKTRLISDQECEDLAALVTSKSSDIARLLKLPMNYRPQPYCIGKYTNATALSNTNNDNSLLRLLNKGSHQNGNHNRNNKRKKH